MWVKGGTEQTLRRGIRGAEKVKGRQRLCAGERWTTGVNIRYRIEGC